MDQTTQKTCDGCGGAITPEEIIQRTAGLVAGKLLCPGCVDKKRREALQARATTQAPAAPAARVVATAAPAPGANKTDEVISLISDDEMPTSKSQTIRSFADGSTIGGAHHDEQLKRPVSGPDAPATRCRTFHGKLTAAGLANMDDGMNEWLDSHPEIYIKNVTSSVGIFEGKTKETHFLVTVFY